MSPNTHNTRLLSYLFASALLLLSSSQLLANPIPNAPTLPARAYILLDYQSGQTLAEKNPDERLDPASLTKLMTAYLVFKELKAGHISDDDLVTVSEKAWRMGGSKMFIEVGKKIPVRELIQGMIVQSGNDASVALAEYIAGDETTFASLMNRQAQALGMTGSHFQNATGLPGPEHYVTPRDIATLASALIRDYPERYPVYSQRSYTYNNIKQHNRNKLLWRDKSVDGLKTGYTKAAGYCLTASAKRDGMRLISVVMGTNSKNARIDQSQTLLNYGFRFYETRKLYSAQQTLSQIPTYNSENESTPVGLLQDLYISVPRGSGPQLKANTKLPEFLTAPIAANAKLGQLTITLGDSTLAERPLVALKANPEGGLWRRSTDSIKLWFK